MWTAFKVGLGLIGAGAAGQVAAKIIERVLPEALSNMGKIVQTVGVVVITGVVAKAGSDYVVGTIEDICKSIQELKNKKETPVIIVEED